MCKDKKNNIWAKGNEVSLKEHTKHAKNCFSSLAKTLKVDDNLKNCINWSILLHDLGKVLPYFQIFYLENLKYKPFYVYENMNIYHSLASILFINQDKLKEKVGEENLKFVLSAIAYHHWKNSLENDLEFSAEKFETLLNYKKIIKKLINNLINELSDLLQNSDSDVIEFNENICGGIARGLSFIDYVIPPYQLYFLPKRLEIKENDKKKWILISGFLQRCDHYASYCEEDGNTNDNNIDIKNIKYEDILGKIKEIIKNNTLWQEEKLNNHKDNLILIAPTGCGKTEFAFLWSNGEKLFYTLPLRAAVEQIYERAKNIFGEDKGEDKVGLLHSDADVYLLNKKENMESIKSYELAKQLSYPVIVSTGDQFFPYGLRPPGYERIFATFSYSRLVVDEVQAYDPKAAAIVVKFIEHIVQMGGKFLLMTATLPEYVKNEIEKRIGDNISKLNLYEENKEKYKKLKKHKLSIITIKNNKSGNKIDYTLSDDIIDDIISKAQNKRVLVILNTVKLAQEVYYKIKDKNIILFHSQFTLNEKQKIKKEIEEKFKNPKDPNENEGKILVATQVVEAALDIDADILFTEICPMDALVQRMGRILRRYKDNFIINDNEESNIYVFEFENGYESGNGKVYDKELIEKTLLHLNNLGGGKTLSEYQKFDLVNNLYKELDPSGKYISDFYSTLSILDAGFMSDRKEEAQRMFREILNVSVIYEGRKQKFIEKVKNFNGNLTYTEFKKDIIAEFVIQIPYYKLNKRKNVTDWINEAKIENKNLSQKLLRWCSDIYIYVESSSSNIEENWKNII